MLPQHQLAVRGMTHSWCNRTVHHLCMGEAPLHLQKGSVHTADTLGPERMILAAGKSSVPDQKTMPGCKEPMIHQHQTQQVLSKADRACFGLVSINIAQKTINAILPVVLQVQLAEAWTPRVYLIMRLWSGDASCKCSS